MFTVMMSLDYAAENRIPGAEYYSLVLFSALGMMLMATAGDLIVIFLGLETMSITVYVLAGILRQFWKWWKPIASNLHHVPRF